VARIRTIKPGFFRHEALQELESLHPGAHAMLVFAGLFTASDRSGRFEWRPKQLKLDILPFLEFDMAKTLELLETFNFIIRYESGGKSYGYIPTFLEHQCPNVKEPQSRIPAPSQHSTSTMPERREGEVEREREEEWEMPGDLDKHVLEIAQAYPYSKYRHEMELPPIVVNAIIKAINLEKGQWFIVLGYAKAYADSNPDPKFVMAIEKFFSDPNKYRKEWGNGASGKTSKFEQYRALLETDAEVSGELAELNGRSSSSQGTSTGIPEIV
jgi:hypothetical protein